MKRLALALLLAASAAAQTAPLYWRDVHMNAVAEPIAWQGELALVPWCDPQSTPFFFHRLKTQRLCLHAAAWGGSLQAPDTEVIFRRQTLANGGTCQLVTSVVFRTTTGPVFDWHYVGGADLGTTPTSCNLHPTSYWLSIVSQVPAGWAAYLVTPVGGW